MTSRLIFFALLFVAYKQSSFAAKYNCFAQQNEMIFRPSVEAKFIGKIKSPLYSAPNRSCKLKNAYVAQGRYITVYSFNKTSDWVYVMYIEKNGEDLMGWLPMRDIKIIGPYGSGR